MNLSPLPLTPSLSLTPSIHPSHTPSSVPSPADGKCVYMPASRHGSGCHSRLTTTEPSAPSLFQLLPGQAGQWDRHEQHSAATALRAAAACGRARDSALLRACVCPRVLVRGQTSPLHGAHPRSRTRFAALACVCVRVREEGRGEEGRRGEGAGGCGGWMALRCNPLACVRVGGE